MVEASAGQVTHMPMVPVGDRPRLPAMSLPAVARRAPNGFLDAYPPQADGDAVAHTDTHTDDIDDSASGESAATGADAYLGAPPDSGSDDDVDVASVDRPIDELQDLMIDVSAGMVHGTVNDVVPGTADEMARETAQATTGGEPIVGPAFDRAIDAGRAIDQSAPPGQQRSTASSPPAGDVETPSPMVMGSTWLGAPTLPSDPAMPMVGTMRTSAPDASAAVPNAAGDAPEILAETEADAVAATPAAESSEHPVAVVVPMIQSIDEPMKTIVAPPRLETGVDLAERPETSATSPRIDERLANAVGAGSPRDVIGDPIVLGGPEFPNRPSGLVAEATDRLMSQLDHLAAGDGGLTDLGRVRVAVTSTDGSRVEMAVERGNGHD